MTNLMTQAFKLNYCTLGESGAEPSAGCNRWKEEGRFL
jgi:hypothetical protein